MTTIDLVPDQLWHAIQPLLPPEPAKPKGGRPRVPDRAVAGAIIFMLRAGLPWRLLPARELSAGSPVTCWRRLRDWQQAGSGNSCTPRCWTNSAARTKSTGRASAWIP
jgi:transposase